MKKAWVIATVGVIVFSFILCRWEQLVSVGMIPFMFFSVGLYIVLLIAMLNVGQIIRYLFSLVCRIGNGPVYVFPVVFSRLPNGGIHFYFSLRALIQPYCSYRVAKAYPMKCRNTKLLRWYAASIWVQLTAKLLSGVTIIGAGLYNEDLLVAALGVALVVLILAVACTEQDEFVGEIVLCRKLKKLDSEFADYFFSMQLALYFLEDRNAYRYFVDELWDKVKRSASSKQLADLLYYVYFSSISDPSICIDQDFNKDVQAVLVKWVKDIAPASPQWWFLNVYIIWAHSQKRQEDLYSLISALSAEENSNNMPIACVKNMRRDVFACTIQYARCGCTSTVGSETNKYKLLYRNVYCGISGPYFKAYEELRNLMGIH